MMILSAAGSAVSAMSSMQAASDTRAAAAYNKQVSDYQAQDAIARGAIEEQKQREQTRQLMGRQRAAMGASGAEVGSGSFGDLLAQSAGMGERDANTIRNNAMRAAWGYTTQGEAQAFEGKAKARALEGQAFGSVLTGAGSVAKKWWQTPATAPATLG